MPEAIDTACRVLETRLAEIEAEAAKIRTALDGLGSPKRRPASPPRPRKVTKAGKRAPRGQRRTEFLSAVKASPGATAAELGKTIGISTNQAYALGQRLLKAGDVKKKGKGYRSA
jgi:hypothetical protein